MDEQHVDAGRRDLLDHFGDDLPLLLHDPVHGLIVLHNHRVLNIGLGRGNLELHQRNLGIDDLGDSPTHMARLDLIKDQPINQFRIIYGAAQLLDNLDIPQVHINGRGGINDPHHSLHSQRGELGVGRHHLATQTGIDTFREGALIGDVDGDRDALNYLEGEVQGFLEALGDQVGVQALLE